MLLLKLEYFSQVFSQTLSHCYRTPCISDYRWNYKADRIFHPHKGKITCISLRWIWESVQQRNYLSKDIDNILKHIKTQNYVSTFTNYLLRYPGTNILEHLGASWRPMTIKRIFGITSEMTCQKSLPTTKTLHTGNETTCSQLSVFSW